MDINKTFTTHIYMDRNLPIQLIRIQMTKPQVSPQRNYLHTIPGAWDGVSDLSQMVSS